jgi:Carboxypeptidase regulatory-like domain
MNSLISIIGVSIFLSLGLTDIGRAETKPAVTFQLSSYAPVVSSIKSLSFVLYQTWDRKGTLVVHSAEWEIRDIDHHRRVARVPAQEYFYADNGTRDERPPQPDGSRNDFDEDDLRHFGPVGPGNYRMALLINGVRASNVIAFKIDPTFDAGKMPVLTAGMDEAPPGGAVGSLLVWIVGPTPEDPQLTNYAVAFADISVDAVILKQTVQAWTGPVGPYQSGKTDVGTYDTKFRLKGIDLLKPHDFHIEVGKYVSGTVHLDLCSQTLGREWDDATMTLAPLPNPAHLLEGVVHNEKGDPASGWEVRIRHEEAQPHTERTNEKGEYAFSNIDPGEYSLGCSPVGSGTPSSEVEHVMIAADQTRKVNFTFEGTYSFSGRVTDSEGRGVKGIPVGATWKDSDSGTECHTGTNTKEDGTYELRGPFSAITYVGIMNSMKNHPSPHYDAKPGAKNIDFIVQVK